MANGRSSHRGKRPADRDGTAFVALPWVVLDSQAYLNLTHAAKVLLIEIARQFVSDNNGRLLCSLNYLKNRGFNSADTVTRTKRELIDAGLIYETVRGHRPNKASWYAVTWYPLNKIPGYDAGTVETYKRSAYRTGTPLSKNSLKPNNGIGTQSIAPPVGPTDKSFIPIVGPTVPCAEVGTRPTIGEHLEKPSPLTLKHD